MNQKKLSFPKKILWGASSSAHQVEGGNKNQWTIWEQENAASLAASASYHYGDLDGFDKFEKEAKQPSNYISGEATSHYELFEQDFDLLKKLNMNAWRFSIEWSRVQPDENEWSAEAIEHYKKYLLELKKRNIAPIVTLFHFTLPIWFEEKGGFTKRKNIKYFEDFCTRIIEELGAHFKYVITINEPEVYAFESYYHGHWPPAQSSRRLALSVLNNCIVAHKRIYKTIKASSRKFQISMAFNVSHVYAGDDATLTNFSSGVFDLIRNRYVLRRSYKHCDFIGLNYYFSERVYGYRIHNPNQSMSDLGWDLQPEDIGRVIDDLYDKYNKAIFVTENGLADADDKKRQWWLKETIQALDKNIKGGVPIIGYLHWSLTDNFEWNKGKWPRFGLFEVDYKTKARIPRQSALALSKILKKVRE